MTLTARVGSASFTSSDVAGPSVASETLQAAPHGSGAGRIGLGLTPASALVLQRVADGLRPDQAVAEHERVDAVVDPGLRRVGRPLQE